MSTFKVKPAAVPQSGLTDGEPATIDRKASELSRDKAQVATGNIPWPVAAPYDADRPGTKPFRTK